VDKHPWEVRQQGDPVWVQAGKKKPPAEGGGGSGMLTCGTELIYEKKGKNRAECMHLGQGLGVENVVGGESSKEA